jgi:calcineurin-like phosphoesterase family protein
MQRFLTSDLHLSHQNIIRFADRPYQNVSDMNLDLVERWNSVVGRDDEVTIVGDLAMGKLDESLPYVKRLNGHKFLVPGNHDRMFGTEGTKYRLQVERYTDVGIETVLDGEFMVNIEGANYLVSHFPYGGESNTDREDRYLDERPTDRGMRLIHGHTHGLWRKSGRMVDVGVDAWGGYPVTFDQVASTFASSEDHLSPLTW